LESRACAFVLLVGIWIGPNELGKRAVQYNLQAD